MEVNARDIIDSVDLNKSEVLLPIYESIVNSIISLCKTKQKDKRIEVFIERKKGENTQNNLYEKEIEPIENVTILDNGEGFTQQNFSSFKKPFSKVNKKFGCKGVGRFTILALFKSMEVVSIFQENAKWKRLSFTFDAENEIDNICESEWEGDHTLQTKVILKECNNPELIPYTNKNIEEIAKGVMEHCFIYYLSETLPEINITEKHEKENSPSMSVKNFFKLEARDKEKNIKVKGNKFKLYILKTEQVTSRKYNYVTLCANSRKVGGKRDLSKYDSLYAYPIVENGESKYLDIYVVGNYLDLHVNYQRTGFKIPESNEDNCLFGDDEAPLSIDDIMKAIANEVAQLYESYAQETKRKNVEEVKKFIVNTAPQYRSFIYRNDILETMPPNLSDEKKDEYLHKVAYKENKKIEEKIDDFIKLDEVNQENIDNIISSIKSRTAYNTDSLAGYVFRRKAILQLFEKMLDKRADGKYELEKMIHNLVFPLGLTNRQLSYQYHNLWLLDDRFSTYRFIASDKSITSFSQIKSSKEPDLVLINNEKNLIGNPISFGNKDAGKVDSLVIFEFKRPGDTAHQKKTTDFRWEFSELVEKYFDDFLFGKNKNNYRGNPVNITFDTPKFGYIIMDVMPQQLIDYNKSKGWRETPMGTYYKINPDQHLHIEAITYQELLKHAGERNNPFFDKLFAIHN